jgi:beta-phosphoglucomutase-like phosphatase (HAD superfamily)
MLGLDGETCACVFDLDGVLTDSGVAHAAAWAAVFDPLLLRQAEQMGHDYRPFDADSDYRSFLDGRPRLEGIHAFLASRGIHLADGRWSDPPESETAFGLARRKGEALERVLRRRGITALPGARRYLEAAGHAGLPRAVVSCSQRTDEMLALAGLTSLVEVTIDATAIEIGGLRSRPAPDVLDAACGALGVRADRAVTFTHTPEGVAAGVAAGMVVVGVGDDATRRQLGGFGAERVAPSLVSLLDRRIALR